MNLGSFADTVKQQADIVRIIGEYVKLKKSGAQNFSGLCPFHNEKTPSFSVHATRQFYHCFGCGVSGDVFSFVQKIENSSFPEAVHAVAQKLGIPLPKVTFDSPAEAREAGLRQKLTEMHERACTFFQEQLRRPEAAHAREYLAGRGLTEETMQKFRMGFAPDSGFLLRDRLKGEYDEETLRASGLFSWKQESSDSPEKEKTDGKAALYSKFRNRVMFPLCSESGKVIAFTGRTLASDEKSGPKYLNSPETAIYSKSRVLFNLDRAREAIRKLEYAILVEGQMDCISVFAAGFHNVIASSGTAFTEAQARLLGRYTKNVVMNFDTDTAGAAATERSLGLLLGEDFQVKVLTLEQGFDPDLLIRRRGAQAYADALKHSQSYFDYLVQRALTLFPAKTAEGKVKAVNFMLPHLQRIPSRIARDELAGQIAQKLSIDSAVLRQELKHAAIARLATPLQAPPKAQVTDAERILLRALVWAGQMQGEARASPREGVDEGFDPARQARFALSSERLHEGMVTEALLDTLLHAEAESDPMSLALSEADRSVLAAILINEEEELTPELLDSALEALRRRHLERRRRNIQAQIAEAERRQDAAALVRLVAEKVEVDRALSRPQAIGA